MTSPQHQEAHTIKYTSLKFFRTLPMFYNMPDAEILFFTESAHIKTYQKGDFLYMEGEEASFFYVICSGWVKISHITEDGEEVVVAMLTKNDVTGESAIFEHGHFATNAQIAEEAEILSVPLVLLKEQISANPQLASNMLTSMVERQRLHEMQMEQYLFYTAPQRVGFFILGLCQVREQKDGVKTVLPYDKSLIANTLGMKGPTFSRALNILRDKTGTRINGSLVTVDSIERLLKFVKGRSTPNYFENGERPKLLSSSSFFSDDRKGIR